jgi:hypothetical protein
MHQNQDIDSFKIIFAQKKFSRGFELTAHDQVNFVPEYVWAPHHYTTTSTVIPEKPSTFASTDFLYN